MSGGVLARLRPYLSIGVALDPPGGNVRVAAARELARARRRGHNAGMAGDDSRAQVQLDEDTLARRRVLGDGNPDTMISANFALVLSGLAADPKAREAMETMKAAWSSRASGREPDS